MFNTVIDSYKYTSLHELNAVLKLYNVMADRGQEDSRTYQNRGLVYRVLDENGNKIGAPVKASAFYNKPTLNNLEKKFAVNEVKRQEHKKRVTVTIDFALVKRKLPVAELVKVLHKEQISTVLRQNMDGLIYGITYVDLRTKCVFNGSDLGKQYNAKGIMERCGENAYVQQSPSMNLNQKSDLQRSKALTDNKESPESNHKLTDHEKLLYDLLKPVQQSDYVLYKLKRKRKKGQRQ